MAAIYKPIYAPNGGRWFMTGDNAPTRLMYQMEQRGLGQCRHSQVAA
jgi:hypothetical protein